jgi:AcrR family transcriptional regulator
MNTGSKRLLRRRDEARDLFRNAILQAAEEVFAMAGFHAARIQDVARVARIAVGTVYNHFDSKDELLAALMEERAAELLACLEPEDGEPADLPARMGRRIERLLAYVAAHRGFYALLLNYGPLGGATGESANLVGRSHRRLQRFRGAFRPLIDEGVAAGLLDEELAPELSAFLWGTIRSVLAQLRFDRDAELVGKAPLILRLFFHGASRRRP